jgi:hypothetical protein
MGAPRMSKMGERTERPDRRRLSYTSMASLSISISQRDLELTWGVVVLGHVDLIIVITDVEGAIAAEDLPVTRPRPEVTENHPLQVAPSKRCRRLHVRERKGGEGGNDGKAVDH